MRFLDSSCVRFWPDSSACSDPRSSTDSSVCSLDSSCVPQTFVPQTLLARSSTPRTHTPRAPHLFYAFHRPFRAPQTLSAPQTLPRSTDSLAYSRTSRFQTLMFPGPSAVYRLFYAVPDSSGVPRLFCCSTETPSCCSGDSFCAFPDSLMFHRLLMFPDAHGSMTLLLQTPSHVFHRLMQVLQIPSHAVPQTLHGSPDSFARFHRLFYVFHRLFCVFHRLFCVFPGLFCVFPG
ncbi:hypothetical protein JOB18_013022 [Solea senegalensis]|uniref:UDENN domain-containing protein n=1 Tax=Solea senegalensis TaxID=28829 RepID=A0AAV6PJ41_SOLSE|nr:hypothetical protein JOB18_013022 [Solea senegalensis]